jgi:hypothetical protein
VPSLNPNLWVWSPNVIAVMVLFDFFDWMYSPSKGARNFPFLALFPVNRVLWICHVSFLDSNIDTSSVENFKVGDISGVRKNDKNSRTFA